MDTKTFIEQVKRNEILDALKSRDYSSLSLKEAFGVISEYPDAIGQLIFGKYRLIITWSSGSSKSICKSEDYIYTLNIASEDNYGNFNWESMKSKELLTRQLFYYMPLIQRFVVDALTDTIDY